MRTIASLIFLLLIGTTEAQEKKEAVKVAPIQKGIHHVIPQAELLTGRLFAVVYLYKFRNSAVRRSLFFIVKKDETVTV
jgi:hypothetical protein